MNLSQQTKRYWLKVMLDWAETRLGDMPGPQAEELNEAIEYFRARITESERLDNPVNHPNIPRFYPNGHAQDYTPQDQEDVLIQKLLAYIHRHNDLTGNGSADVEYVMRVAHRTL